MPTHPCEMRQDSLHFHTDRNAHPAVGSAFSVGRMVLPHQWFKRGGPDWSVFEI
ncbi:hypothetical protein ACLD9W_01745 [Neisseria sp. WLZKY-1]|uniref:hypothetical protein n=1 Tax=Neisseria sp. WLZKY-1 TaxID=3390377 RepID=UPI00397A6BA9